MKRERDEDRQTYREKEGKNARNRAACTNSSRHTRTDTAEFLPARARTQCRRRPCRRAVPTSRARRAHCGTRQAVVADTAQHRRRRRGASGAGVPRGARPGAARVSVARPRAVAPTGAQPCTHGAGRTSRCAVRPHGAPGVNTSQRGSSSNETAEHKKVTSSLSSSSRQMTAHDHYSHTSSGGGGGRCITYSVHGGPPVVAPPYVPTSHMLL